MHNDYQVKQDQQSMPCMEGENFSLHSSLSMPQKFTYAREHNIISTILSISGS